MPDRSEPLDYDYETGARYLGCATSLLKKLVWKGEISHVKVGRLTRFRQSDLDEYIASRARPVMS